MAGRKVFTSGEILTAADVNSYLMDQSVMVFADSTARSSAIPSPTEGMVTYLKDVNQVSAFTGSAFTPVGTILQVVSTTKTDVFTMSSTTFAQPTDFNVAITPSSTSSKVLVTGTISMVGEAGERNAYARLMRDSTAIFAGDASGSRLRGFAVVTGSAGNDAFQNSFSFLDSPNTTSSITYSVEVRSTDAGLIFVNRSSGDQNNASGMRTASTITVMEVAG